MQDRFTNLSQGHRVALGMGIAGLVGVLTPWARMHAFGVEEIAHGYHETGWWVAVFALAAVGLLLFGPDARWRTFGSAGAFGVAALAPLHFIVTTEEGTVSMGGWGGFGGGSVGVNLEWGVFLTLMALAAAALASLLGHVPPTPAPDAEHAEATAPTATPPR